MTVAMVWFLTIELILRHAGYPLRVAVSVALAGQSAWTARTLHCGLPVSWRGVKTPSLLAGALGLYIVLQNSRAVHFEGYLTLIGALLVAQALLAVATPPGAESGRAI